MKSLVSSTVLVLAMSALFTQAAGAGMPSPQQASAVETMPIAGYTVGEVRRIDVQRGTVTLQHEPIENLGMPDMTMAFRVAQPNQITSLKIGEKIRFKAVKVHGALVITELMAVN